MMVKRISTRFFTEKFNKLGLMSSVQTIFQAAFDLNQVWWLIIKAAIWFGVALIIIAKTDTPHPEKAFKSIRSTLGFFLMFIFLSTGLLYLLFGQVPV
jgi:hypothetical protein